MFSKTTLKTTLLLLFIGIFGYSLQNAHSQWVVVERHVGPTWGQTAMQGQPVGPTWGQTRRGRMWGQPVGPTWGQTRRGRMVLHPLKPGGGGGPPARIHIPGVPRNAPGIGPRSPRPYYRNERDTIRGRSRYRDGRNALDKRRRQRLFNRLNRL